MNFALILKLRTNKIQKLEKYQCQRFRAAIIILIRSLKTIGFTTPQELVLLGRLTPIFFPLPGKLDNLKFKIEIADTPEERIKGLSGRESFDENTGLLFIHDEPGIYGIWMKDMNFPIDVIWLDENYYIVDIASDVQPDSFPEVFEPGVPALYILEVNAGFARRNGIETGDNLKYIINL